MRFSLFLTGFVASLATAAPSKKRQATAAPVFTAKTFADLSIAGGTAGDGAAEAQAALAGLPADLTTVAPEDIEFLSAVNSIANDAGKKNFSHPSHHLHVCPDVFTSVYVDIWLGDTPHTYSADDSSRHLQAPLLAIFGITKMDIPN